jgi:hypothetical protein
MQAKQTMATLMEIIEKFAESRRARLDTPEGAYCMCDATSDAFVRFAHAAGYEGELKAYTFDSEVERLVDSNTWVWEPSPRNPDPTLYRRGKHASADFTCCNWHCVVETPEFFVDFTARQYHSNACYPHIISKCVAIMSKPHVDIDDTHAETINGWIKAMAAAAAGGN